MATVKSTMEDVNISYAIFLHRQEIGKRKPNLIDVDITKFELTKRLVNNFHNKDDKIARREIAFAKHLKLHIIDYKNWELTQCQEILKQQLLQTFNQKQHQESEQQNSQEPQQEQEQQEQSQELITLLTLKEKRQIYEQQKRQERYLSRKALYEQRLQNYRNKERRLQDKSEFQEVVEFCQHRQESLQGKLNNLEQQYIREQKRYK